MSSMAVYSADPVQYRFGATLLSTDASSSKLMSIAKAEFTVIANVRKNIIFRCSGNCQIYDIDQHGYVAELIEINNVKPKGNLDFCSIAISKGLYYNRH